jgi:glutamyl-tRNA reductase
VEGRQTRRAPEAAIRAACAAAERARQQVLAKHARQLSSLSEQHRAAVDAVTRGLVDRLVGAPLSQARQLADGNDNAASFLLLCRLFASDEPTDETRR